MVTSERFVGFTFAYQHLSFKRILKEHILIGDSGQACIANTGHICIVSTGFAASKTLMASGVSLDVFRWRWAAPELQRPDEYDMTEVVATKSSDIYGMGMVIYEASRRNLLVSLWYLISAQVLTRDIPFHGYTDSAVLAKVQSGEKPGKPTNALSLGITDSIWMLLEQCWDWEPACRPDSPHLLNVLRGACQSGYASTATPTQIKLQVKDVTVSLTKKRKINLCISLRYGTRVHTTSRATAVGEDKYVWYEISLTLSPPTFHGPLQE